MNAIFEIGIVLLLIVANGVFAIAEIALVSAKRPRLAIREFRSKDFQTITQV